VEYLRGKEQTKRCISFFLRPIKLYLLLSYERQRGTFVMKDMEGNIAISVVLLFRDNKLSQEDHAAL
jgi:hypothetical protein